MKNLLITLGTLTTLALTSNSITPIITNINNNLKSKANAEVPRILNYKYGYLSNNDWITNQSTSGQFYSYDTSLLATYTFANARDTFLVDTNGNLVANPDVTVPKQDQIDINNTQQEMITHRKITNMKSFNNLYSKSEYANNYFDNTWQYLQEGGTPNHINISNQQGGNKIENNTNLSESLGLYYIAKAVKNNQITEALADNLGKYFISESSIKDNFNSTLTNTIINLISQNNNIFNFICRTPISVNTKNYSINYIFDNNNLVEVYYNTWNVQNPTTNVNYKWDEWYQNSHHYDNSNTYAVLNWKQYANTWDDFITLYPKINFNSDSIMEVENTNWFGNYQTSIPTIYTKNMKADQGADNEQKNEVFQYKKAVTYLGLTFTLSMWYLGDNIYFRWYLDFESNHGAQIEISLSTLNFPNIMS